MFKNRNGKELREAEKIKETWRQYIEDLYIKKFLALQIQSLISETLLCYSTFFIL